MFMLLINLFFNNKNVWSDVYTYAINKFLFSFSDLSTSRSLKQLMAFNTFSISFLSLIRLCTSIIGKKLDVIFLIQWLSISFEHTGKKSCNQGYQWFHVYCHSSSSSPPKKFQAHLHTLKLSKLVCTCNDPGAQGRSFSYTFGKECDIRNLRVSENRKTRLLQFNGILFKVCLSCSKQDRGYSLLGIKVLLNMQAKAQVIYGWYSTLLLLSSLQNSAIITTSN